jgi:hypothetical protein
MIDFGRASSAYRPHGRKARIERDPTLEAQADGDVEQGGRILALHCPCTITDSYGGIIVWHLDVLDVPCPLLNGDGQIDRFTDPGAAERAVRAMRFKPLR